MSTGPIALLDDIAAIAKLAAASLDDIAVWPSLRRPVVGAVAASTVARFSAK